MSKRAQRITLKLPEVLDRSFAAEHLPLLRECAGGERAFAIDASRVVRADIDCVELLLAIFRDHPGSEIESASESFVRLVTALNLRKHFNMPDESLSANETAIGAAVESEATDGDAQNDTDMKPMTKRILTIDDSKTMRDMLMLTLAEAGFDVLQAVDGEDGLNVLGRGPVDLVITDINMPKLDGYEVIRRIRANPAYRKLPILVLTTEAEADKRAIAKEAGATGWMVKPFDPERLVQTVIKVAA